MKRSIIKLLGGVTQEELNEIKELVFDLKKEYDRFRDSYAMSWLDYKSSIDLKKLKKKLIEMVTTQKPKVDYCWGSTSDVYLFYDKETYLSYSNSFGCKGHYSGFLDGFGYIPPKLAEEMFTIADKIQKNRDVK